MNSLHKKIALGLATALAALATLTACGDKYNEPFRDGPRSSVTNRNPADIIENPDGFSNVATKCDHGNRLYVAYHGDSKYAAVAVSPHDPSCG